MNYSSEQQSAITGLLREVLSTTKPEEAFLADHVFEAPVNVQRRTDALGFGGGAEVILWIYPLFHIFCELAKGAGDGFSKKWGEQLAQWLWGDRRAARLEPEALGSLRKAVVQRLSKEGIAIQDCERVGDSVLAVLIDHPDLLKKISPRT